MAIYRLFTYPTCLSFCRSLMLRVNLLMLPFFKSFLIFFCLLRSFIRSLILTLFLFYSKLKRKKKTSTRSTESSSYVLSNGITLTILKRPRLLVFWIDVNSIDDIPPGPVLDHGKSPSLTCLLIVYRSSF